MSLLEKINKERLPRHIAIIMDGNGRWAKLQGKERFEGHKEGVVSVRKVIEAATELKVPYVTLYTFSTENWNRPEEEIRALMALMVQAIANETPDLIKNNIRLQTIGDIDRLPEETRASLNKCIQDTSSSTGLTLVLALSYSSRWEITNATKQIATDVKNGKLDADSITEDTISNYLTTRSIPDPDLLIRTGGEFRISNFLLWQTAYTEFYFTDTLWPDFRGEALYAAIINYQARERRFGKTSEQVSSQQK
ncbi:undecaprenyl diphosphate synthase [Dysgonomonas sp. PH5-45]|uniref:isoprenyl transferase n=1 Tax=unclassified Dysgonomonas TaxID=2630389 RepID=UPI002475B8BC|nr:MULTISPECIES: isoprenyl transferase [unclassified Dysgonomonas]MDH6354154.1 undecaprenyl diphosphate synthase [Dysgonomonas sp. PH5-45]MDH6386995.1 undecaprenyl diphosphate synthase [Dysgonomonas sp. PH5-37]